ncbi:MAG: ABC transporter substrate-binding protein [Nanoarchaeota archaeon]
MESFLSKSAVITLILLLLVSCSPTLPPPKTESSVVEVGAILPLTGSGSDQGVWIKNALEVAADDIKEKDGIDVNLVFEDSKGGNPKEAITAYQAITQFHKVPAIVTWGSGVGTALIPMADTDKIVQVGVATATPKYSIKEDYSFRLFPSTDLEGKYNADLVYNILGMHEAGIVYSDNDYGVSEKDAFATEFKRLGGTIVDVEAINPAETDYRTQVLKLKNLNPRIVFLAVYPKEGLLFLKQSVEEGLASKMFASTAIVGSDVFKDASAQGIIISLQKFDSGSSDQDISRFVSSYKARFNDAPEIYQARAYDSLRIIVDNLKECTSKSDGQCLKDSLEKMASSKGVTGDISFNEFGDLASAEFNLKTIKDGKLAPFEVVK